MGEANFLQVLIAPEYKILGSTGINRDIGYCENSLYDLRIGMQLIALSYYKKKIKNFLELLNFSHITLGLVLYSKMVLFWNSQIKLI